MRIAGIAHQIHPARPADLKVGLHRVHQAGILSQINTEPRRVEASAQHRAAELQGVVVGLAAGQVEILRQQYLILDPTAVGYRDAGRPIRRHRRQIDCRCRPVRAPGTELLLDRGLRLLRRDVADHDDRGQVGAKGVAKVGSHILQRERAYGLGGGLTQTWIVLRKQRFPQGMLRQMARTPIASRDHLGHLLAHDVEGCGRQGRVQFIVRQQLDATFEILAQHLQREFSSGALARSDRIQRLLVGHPIELLAAVGQQQIQ